MRYFIVDVFGQKKYSGNQLAVVALDKEIPDSEMQKIANEFHFSETTFILPEKRKRNIYDVRIFTPKKEVPFAGHPALGTAYIIRNELTKSKTNKIVLNLKAGQIPITFKKDDHREILWMKQIEPTFGRIYDSKDISKMINLSNNDININFPIQEVSTGLPFIIIPITTLQAVKKASTNLLFYKSFFQSIPPRPLLLFCPETYDKKNDVNCRMFADLFGIPEDPATGSGNGCLAAYLVKHKYFNSCSIDIKAEQGYKIGRKSLLYLRAEKKKDKIDVNVGGNVIKVAEGVLI
jgi:trans-2,3-dihydro-3-hydroxyanthranilate isomerase